MPKNLLQDIVKVKHSLNGGMRETQMSQKENRPDSAEQDRDRFVRSSGRPRYMLWFVAVISVVFLFFALSHLFLNVVVTINPKVENVVLDENLSASKNGDINALSFDLIIISGEESEIVQTTETKNVSERARGVVSIYNAFSSAPQRLDIDTRLEGSNGKIYKTQKQVIVPGMKGNIPGSVEVGIYGKEAGEEYNSGPLDFTIFGFKGTPKYSKFYARSKGEITGGSDGKMPVVSDAQKLAATNDLKKVLQTELFKKATDQIPKGFILFKDAALLRVDDSNINIVSSNDDTFSMKLKGTLYGFLFNIDKLTKKIAENNISEYDDSDVYLANIQDLVFSLPSEQASLSNKDGVSLEDIKNINFNLKGTTKIIWKLDETQLKTDFLGKSKKDFYQILLQYPNIDSADLVISPFWKTSLPDKTKNIKVIVNYPK